MLTSATKRKIDNARDILVGKIPMPTAQVEQITLALIYKFMSDIDKRSKALGDTSGFFANGYEKYAWDNLMDKSLSARDRVTLYSEGLEKMSKNPHIPQLFRDIFKNAFLPFRSPETLKLFLEQIDEFQYDHSEELGNAFEYLLSVMGSQGDAGQFRTPRHIIDFIVKVVDPSKTDTILDPACGTAGFLISAYKHIREQGLTAEEQKKLTDNFVGYDISHDMQRLAMVNMYLHHFPDPKIFEYDTLSSEDRWDDDFDVILANPPFMTPKGGIKPHSRFSVKSKQAEVLFTDYISEHLNQNGRAGVIVPVGVVFQNQSGYNDLRKKLVNDSLWAVVSLPAGIFNPYSDAETSILFLDKKLSKKNENIIFLKVNNDGYSLGKQRKNIDENDIPAIERVLLDYKDQKEINLEHVQIVKKSRIRENNYLLVGDRYINRERDEDVVYIKLGEFLKRNKSPVNIEDHVSYKRATIRLYGKGIELRDELLGKDIGTKRQFVVRKNQLLLSKIDARSGAFGIVPDELDGGIITGNFWAYDIDESLINRFYLSFLLSSEKFYTICRDASSGVTNRKYLNEEKFLSLELDLPTIDHQNKVVEKIQELERAIDKKKSELEKIIKDEWK